MSADNPQPGSTYCGQTYALENGNTILAYPPERNARIEYPGLSNEFTPRRACPVRLEPGRGQDAGLDDGASRFLGDISLRSAGSSDMGGWGWRSR